MKYIYYILLLINILSCNYHTDKQLEHTLKFARYNRQELETLLKHYTINIKDSLKYKAACFLIKNMELHSSYKNEDLRQYFVNTNETFRRYKNKKQFQTIYDSLTQSYQLKNFSKQNIYDCQQIKSDYLIENINNAFKLWELPWARHLSFDDFCEFLLPYKVNEDVIEHWRPLYANRLITVDSLLLNKEHADIESVCERINDSIESVYGNNAASYQLKIPYTYPSVLIDMQKGTCSEQTQLATYFMRSLGVPACIDFVPQWGNRSSGHSWNMIKTPNGYPANFNFSKLGHLEKVILSEKVTKIYRRTYARQKNNLFHLSLKKNEDIPDFFKDPYLSDVTSEYESIVHLSTIGISNLKPPLSKEFAYIAVFNNHTWTPIGWSTLKKGEVNFKQIGNDVVYIVGIYDNNSFIPITHPFLLTEQGKLNYLEPDYNKTQSTILYRKYSPYRAKQHAKRMLHGKFQASNTADFKKVVDLYCVDQIPESSYTTIQIDGNKKYRYLRYIGPDSMHCNIAELEVFTNSNSNNAKLTGNIIGTEGSFRDNEERTKLAVFDGDPLTFFDALSPDSSWIGLDFTKPELISAIRFMPRNDDNNIRVGDMYELMYWNENKKWTSLGKKIAKDNKLIYENVPSGTLYLLHNHTRGKEERIFTYENNQQVWW